MKNFFIAAIFLVFCFIAAANAQSGEKSAQAQEIEKVKAYLQKYNFYKKDYVKTDNTGKKTDEVSGKYVRKITADSDRKSYLMNGNKIQVELTNYGGIGTGYGGIREISDVVWKGLPYVFQFVPIVGASVPDARDPSKRLHIISDAINDWAAYNLVEWNTDKDTLWQFQPLPGYADPNQEDMAHNPDFDSDQDGKPDSWPREWYNETLGEYVWPGYLQQNVNNADLEVFWAMDDKENREFPYFPYNNSIMDRGIGVQVDGRAFQWSNSLAENTVFFVYTITNVSDKDLDSVFFGVYGDPDLGGANDNDDDIGFFIPPYSIPNNNVDDIPLYARSMVYFTDDEPVPTGNFGLPLGYLGCKFLESPGNPNDAIDNDGDGMIDESQFDGIDNDGDWNVDLHDLGEDGISNTGDLGEGDGLPTRGRVLANGSLDPLFPGEPNFEYTDLDEADQIGLTSFSNWNWGDYTGVNQDELMWKRNRPLYFEEVLPEGADIAFTFGSGYISLKKGESKRISMALLLGDDLDDLLTTAITVQDIYNKNYNFFKPPDLPVLTAVPGDKKVTLYWDTKSEESVDPIKGKDFEGYVLYRSTDPSFSDIQGVTDGKGTGFLLEPLKDFKGIEAKWDLDIIDEPFTDLNGNGIYNNGEPYLDYNKDGTWSSNIEDVWRGYHPVAYQERGIHYYLGDNRGLVHSFVDSNNVINGQTYYYALAAFDHGDSLGIPPSETTKKINVDPITSEVRFDKNTLSVVPGPRANGYEAPVITSSNVNHSSGIATGKVNYEILNDLLVDENSYTLYFDDTLRLGNSVRVQKNYFVKEHKIYQKTINFFGTKFADIGHVNIADDESLKLTDGSGNEYAIATDYIVDFQNGKIRRSDNSSIPDNSGIEYALSYRRYPVINSAALNGEDTNPIFNGIRLSITDNPVIDYDASQSRWVNGQSNFTFSAALSSIGGASAKLLYPADYEFVFSDNYIDSAYVVRAGRPRLKVPVQYKVNEITSGVANRIQTVINENGSTTPDTSWTPGEEIILYRPGDDGTKTTDKFTWGVKIAPPQGVDPVYPSEGSVLRIATKRPFTEQDTFHLVSHPGALNNQLASSGMENIYVVPNPYVGYNELEPSNKLPGQTRGERRIYFENLPAKCTIRIFTLSGDPVKVLQHDSGVSNAREYWNLLNEDGFSVAYGLYFAHVEAPGVGEKIIKFALIK